MTLKILIFLIIVINYVYSKQERIVGGTEAEEREFPYHAVLRRINDNSFICGGAIISEYHILTAAHCVHERMVPQNNLKISLGGYNWREPFTSEHLPYRIIIHSLFMINSNDTGPNYDIAVIKTSSKIHFNQYQKKIALPTKNIREGDITILSGWGSISYPTITLPEKLQKINALVLEYSTCEALIPWTLYGDQFCTHMSIGTGGCLGDGGSPLVRNRYIIGIFSLSYMCARGLPDVYTNVYIHLRFIKSAMSV